MSCKSKDKRHHYRQLGPMELDVDYGALQISILSIQSKTFSAYITRLHTVQVLSIAQVANLKLISKKDRNKLSFFFSSSLTNGSLYFMLAFKVPFSCWICGRNVW